MKHFYSDFTRQLDTRHRGNFFLHLIIRRKKKFTGVTINPFQEDLFKFGGEIS